MRVKVRKDDSLWYYSRLFQIPLQMVIDSNSELSPSQLTVGQTVNIPGYRLQPYRIKPGDTFFSLSRKYQLMLDSLLLVNQNVNPKKLASGELINLPLRVTQPILNGRREYDFQALNQDIRQLAEIYPFIRVQSIGNTIMGKPIFELQIGNGPKKVHVNGSFHANEWITTPIIMTFVNQYLLSLTNNSTIRGFVMPPFYDAITLSIVPMVNPDGVDLVLNGPPETEPFRSLVRRLNRGSEDFSGWKANIRGVDLNNQFPARWEIEKERKPQQPGPRDYPGDRPLTEPEANAIARLTGRSDFDRVLAFHTQGEEIYWGFLNLEPPESETIVNEFSRVSGYDAVRTIDSYAGYKDWFIQNWRRPGFTIELGEGVNPLPLSQFDEIYEESLGIFLASLYM